MDFPLDPLRVECKQCKASAETYDYAHPDWAPIGCNCCPVAHDHTGLGCRSVTVYATAYLTMFSLEELMEMTAEKDRQFEYIPEKELS